MARYDLQLCNRHRPGTTLVVDIDGASNPRGRNASTGNPFAVLGKTMPAGCTLYEEGTTPLTSYTTDHFGPEVGFMDRLKNYYNFPDPIVVIKWGIEGASLTSWNSAISDALLAVFPTTGFPITQLWIQGGAEAGNAVDNPPVSYQDNLLILVSRHRRLRGHGKGITIGLFKSVDEVEYPSTAFVRQAQIDFVDNCQGTRVLDTSSDVDFAMDSTSHYIGLSQYNIGALWVEQLIEDRIISV